jgi:GNAT superfamily N-acetyltransferase
MAKTVDARVRSAEAGDRDKIWPLARDFTTSFQLDRACYNTSFEKLVNQPDALLIIADTPTADVRGYLLAFTHHTFLANGPVTWVEELMVAEEGRCAGTGRRLMVAAENWSASKGAAYVALATRRAADFYLALGYTESAAFFCKMLTTPEPENSGATSSRPPGPTEVDTANSACVRCSVRTGQTEVIR